jgi:hypothetical protein
MTENIFERKIKIFNNDIIIKIISAINKNIHIKLKSISLKNTKLAVANTARAVDNIACETTLFHCSSDLFSFKYFSKSNNCSSDNDSRFLRIIHFCFINHFTL